MRIVVVGAGFMGRSYARIVRAHPLAELAGIVDVNDEVAARAAQEIGTADFTGIAA